MKRKRTLPAPQPVDLAKVGELAGRFFEAAADLAARSKTELLLGGLALVHANWSKAHGVSLDDTIIGLRAMWGFDLEALRARVAVMHDDTTTDLDS